jgi:hypothetical protein
MEGCGVPVKPEQAAESEKLADVPKNSWLRSPAVQHGIGVGRTAAVAMQTSAAGVQNGVALFQAIAKVGNVRGVRIAPVLIVTSSNCETHHRRLPP